MKSTYFTFCGEIYEQTEGVAKGSPLSPIVANLFMEHYERKVLDLFTYKTKRWIIFFDNIYNNCPHGEARLVDFTNHFNIHFESIKFTVEK